MKNTTIERLKASKAEYDARAEAREVTAYGAGMEAGREWAEESASYAELKRLAEHEPYCGSWEVELSLYDDDRDRGIPAHLYATLTGNDPDPELAACYWRKALKEYERDANDAVDDWDFALGFVTGALDVWEQVKGKLG